MAKAPSETRVPCILSKNPLVHWVLFSLGPQATRKLRVPPKDFMYVANCRYTSA